MFWVRDFCLSAHKLNAICAALAIINLAAEWLLCKRETVYSSCECAARSAPLNLCMYKGETQNSGRIALRMVCSKWQAMLKINYPARVFANADSIKRLLLFFQVHQRVCVNVHMYLLMLLCCIQFFLSPPLLQFARYHRN